MPKTAKSDLQLLQDLATEEAALRAQLAKIHAALNLKHKLTREATARERDRQSLVLGRIAFDAGLTDVGPARWQAVCAALPAFLAHDDLVQEWLALWGKKTHETAPIRPSSV